MDRETSAWRRDGVGVCMPPGTAARGYEGSRNDPDVVGLDGRENVRSTLGFLGMVCPLGAAAQTRAHSQGELLCLS